MNKKILILVVGILLSGGCDNVVIASRSDELKNVGQDCYNVLINDSLAQYLSSFEKKLLEYAASLGNEEIVEIMRNRYDAVAVFADIKEYFLNDLNNKYLKKTLTFADNNEIILALLDRELIKLKKPIKFDTPRSLQSKERMAHKALTIIYDLIWELLNPYSRNHYSRTRSIVSSIENVVRLSFLLVTRDSIIAGAYLFDSPRLIGKFVGESIPQYKNIRLINNIKKAIKAVPVKP